MCLIVIAWRTHRDFPLIVAANRDEFFRRPTDPAHWWQDAPQLLAGRDQQRGGTWLGVTKQGRVAMVTNYREPPSGPPAPQSRGALVGDYLKATMPAAEYLREISGRRTDYDGFNLIAGDQASLWFLGKREPVPRELTPGIHGMSNGDLDAPWPKVVRAKHTLFAILDRSQSINDAKRGGFIRGALLSLLADRAPALDANLPDTGIGHELERKLSPIFVHMDGYGTRSSTAMLVDRGGAVRFHERSFGPDGQVAGDSVHEFRIGQE